MEASRKPTAWEIETRLLEALNELDALDDCEAVPAEISDMVSDALMAAVEKRDALAGAMLRKEAEMNALLERAADARAKADRIHDSLAWVRNYVLLILEKIGEKKIHGAQYSIAWQENPKHVEVDDGFDLEEYVTRIVEIRPNKVGIAAALKAGKEIPGARLVESGKRVVIR